MARDFAGRSPGLVLTEIGWRWAVRADVCFFYRFSSELRAFDLERGT